MSRPMNRSHKLLALPVALTLLTPVASTAQARTPEVPLDQPGLEMLVDADPNGSSHPSHLTRVGRSIFFLAGAEEARYLWRTDGTAGGTRRIDGLPAFDCWSACEYGAWPSLRAAGGDLFTAVGRKLWRTRGDTGATRLLKGRTMSGHLTPAAGRLFFATSDQRGNELWVSDGSVRGTHIVRDIWPGQSSGVCVVTGGDFCLDEPLSIRGIGKRVFFVAHDGVHGHELWVTDGSEGGTRMVRDIRQVRERRYALGTPFPDSFIALGDRLAFVADDGLHGRELWLSDGTRAGTRMVRDIAPGRQGALRDPRFRVVDGRLFFIADDGVHGRELWVSDGRRSETRMVRDIGPGSTGARIQLGPSHDGMLWFRADDGVHGAELWRTDGTRRGTRMVSDIRRGERGSKPSPDTILGGRLMFVANDGIHGRELWISDGRRAGTRMVADIREGPKASQPRWSSQPGWMTRRRGAVWLVANDGIHGPELWRSDGTRGGTWLVADASPIGVEPDECTFCEARGPQPIVLGALGRRLLLSFHDGVHGRELWALDTAVAAPATIRASRAR